MTVDWYRIVNDLVRCGVSVRQLAMLTRVRYGRLYRAWRDPGQDLRHADGERLLRFWCERTHRERSDVPIYRR